MSQTYPLDPEEALVSRAIKRDPQAFASLYDRHVDQVYRHVYYRLSTRADAEDITQEVFIRAWKAIDRYKGTGAPFVAWLLTIAHNLIVDHHRAARKSVPLDEVEVVASAVETDPVAMAEALADSRVVRSAVLKLSGEKQKVIFMRFIDGFSYGEIARILKKTEGAVRVIQFRALADLRRLLAEGK